jgi:hypothetical protein
MAPSVPADDTERVQLSGPLTLVFAVLALVLLLGTMTCVAAALVFSVRDIPLGAVFLGVVLLTGGVWWRWGTPLRGVVATRTGLLLSGPRGVCFVPYESVALARESRVQRCRPITVTLSEPLAGMDRFVFVPPNRPFLRFDDAHPSAVALLRRLARLKCDECGSPYIQGSAAMVKLCAECSHLLYGSPACQHQFDPAGACGQCGWNRSRSEYTAKLATGAVHPR